MRFPLDEQDINVISDEALISAFNTGSVIYHEGGNKIVRISQNLVIKGGFSVLPSEAANMRFATQTLNLPVPKVRRVFNIKASEDIWGTTCYIMMDYVKGTSVDKCWSELPKGLKSKIISQLASMINQMQSTVVAGPPGPVGCTKSRLMGLWFSDYGAGPFETLGEMEDWFNYALEISQKFNQALPGTPRFILKKLVFSHMDVAPRNLLIDENSNVWVIDWACAGAYPPGFEQAVVSCQIHFPDFNAALLKKVTESPTQNVQLKSIRFSLNTASITTQG